MAHYHIMRDGEDQGAAYIAHTIRCATDILKECVKRSDMLTTTVQRFDLVECRETDTCGPYLDLLAWEAYNRGLSDPVVLMREYERMVIESDGHGPLEDQTG